MLLIYSLQPYSGHYLMLSSLYSLLGTTDDYDPKIKKGTIFVHSLSCIWCSDDGILFSNHYLQALYRLVKAGQGETFAVLQVNILTYHLLSVCYHKLIFTILILSIVLQNVVSTKYRQHNEVPDHPGNFDQNSTDLKYGTVQYVLLWL